MNIQVDEELEDPVLNLTPMIDVVFQLLIFFMVATTFLDPEREIDVELPEAQAGSTIEELDEIVVNVMRDGSVVLGGETVSSEGLVAALRRASGGSSEKPVTIRGDRLAHHESIVTVMDACEAAGLYKLAVGTSEAQ